MFFFFNREFGFFFIKNVYTVLKKNNPFFQDEIHTCFDVSKFPMTYVMYIVVYGGGMGTLVYFLADNVWSKSKLSPRRVKQWSVLPRILQLITQFSYRNLFHCQLKYSIEVPSCLFYGENPVKKREKS